MWASPLKHSAEQNACWSCLTMTLALHNSHTVTPVATARTHISAFKSGPAAHKSFPSLSPPLPPPLLQRGLMARLSHPPSEPNEPLLSASCGSSVAVVKYWGWWWPLLVFSSAVCVMGRGVRCCSLSCLFVEESTRVGMNCLSSGHCSDRLPDCISALD